jgi:hypothetical protein
MIGSLNASTSIQLFTSCGTYSATEPIASGVDVRTVASRLGHAGGGTTTLRAYTAWMSEVDQRVAKNIGGTQQVQLLIGWAARMSIQRCAFVASDSPRPYLSEISRYNEGYSAGQVEM